MRCSLALIAIITVGCSSPSQDCVHSLAPPYLTISSVTTTSIDNKDTKFTIELQPHPAVYPSPGGTHKDSFTRSSKVEVTAVKLDHSTGKFSTEIESESFSPRGLDTAPITVTVVVDNILDPDRFFVSAYAYFKHDDGDWHKHPDQDGYTGP